MMTKISLKGLAGRLINFSFTTIAPIAKVIKKQPSKPNRYYRWQPGASSGMPVSKTKPVNRTPRYNVLQDTSLFTRPLQRALVNVTPHPRLFQTIVVFTRITLHEKQILPPKLVTAIGH